MLRKCIDEKCQGPRQRYGDYAGDNVAESGMGRLCAKTFAHE